MAPPTCSDLPVSSSMWTRSMPTRTCVFGAVLVLSVTSSQPSMHSGSSYWEIWKSFGMSG